LVIPLQTFWQNLRKLWQSEEDSLLPTAASAGRSIAWVLPRQLAVGAFPEQTDLGILQEQGVQAIVSLCDPTEARLCPEAQTGFHCVQFTLPDSRKSVPFQREDLAKAVDLVRQSILEKGTTYVHCLAGIERSPTVCIAYLCQYHHLQVWEALNWLKEINPRTGVTSEQLRVITDYLNRVSA
jgi:hypothetical protein